MRKMSNTLLELNTEWAQVEVIDLINDGSGLAFGIIGGRSTGVVVKTILPGGVADRDGRLQSGDHILQIGEVNLRGLGSEQVASVLRQCGIHVRLVVARPVEPTSADYQALGSHAPIVPTKILGDPVELDKHLIENGYSTHQAPSVYSTPFLYSNQSDFQIHPISGAVDVVKNPLPIGDVPVPVQADVPVITNMLPLDMALHEPNLPETETYTVELKKDDLGLGITVAGYVCEREEISGIFVKSISKGSAADLIGKIKINDRIIEVDGVSVLGHTNHQAVEVLRCSSALVTIKFERYLRGPKYEQLQQAIRANELRPPSPSSPTISTLPKIPLSLVQYSYLGIEPEGESRTSFDFDSAVLLETNGEDEENQEIVIDCKQSLQFSINSHESIYKTWRQKVADDVEIVIAQMEKEPNKGLGISLEGTVDVEDGKEVRPHHYIRNILPDGPVGRNGLLCAGDELLEVNGLQLMGLNHLEVVSILKQLPNFVSLVCARYPVPIRVIDTSQHREAFQARKILAGSLQTLIPINDRLVKAKSETSIASSFGSEICNESRSRSLELVTGLPMWNSEPTEVELIKGDYGLGFSILDYQDPLNSQETVIVIRSLVPGGVAQQDGRLIPGDRLLSVNSINVEHATLDRAVQVLKGAPKGPVRIVVAKPLSQAHDAISHASQLIRSIIQEWYEELEYLVLDDTEEDQTCLEDFQECIEEYQECLEVVHICIDEDNSLYNQSPCTSQVEDLVALMGPTPANNSNFLDNNYLNASKNNKHQKSIDSVGDSDIDVSYKSTNNDHLNNKIECDISQILQSKKPNLRTVLNKADSLTQSDKDGYETCIDESLSEEGPKNLNNNDIVEEDLTPTNSKNISAANSEPCLIEEPCTRLLLDTRLDEEPKSYDQNKAVDPDEFFLVQYPPISRTYRLREYYNDYIDCLDSYRKVELHDDAIFNDIYLPFKSRSAPNVMDSSFVTMTYDPGPDRARRKSDFVAGHQCTDDSEDALTMTVIKPIDADYGTLKNSHVSEMLQKHWGSTHTIKVYREANSSLGISIVGGKVDLDAADTPSDKILGIFVKQVVPDSPAGRTGLFKTGDRILEVSGIDLRQESHQKAVEAIRNASNPVTFVIQSLIPWKYENDDTCYKSNENNCKSPYPSPVSEKQSTVHVPEIKITNEVEKNDGIREIPEEIIIASPTSIEIVPSDSVIDKGVDGVATKIASVESTDEEEEDEEDIREMEGRTVSSKGQPIDRASAANLKRSKDEIANDPEDEDVFGYTINKVKKKYASLGHTILMVQLERSNQGLGLSLAGHKDRNCMAVFVCGLNPNGAAYKTGGIQIGDEILEVNGVVLHGRCHLNASAIIKGLSGPIFKVIILRRKTAIDDIAVKPLTQFPVSLAEEASEEQFSATYPNVRTVTVKKGNQSLGIMIIEGKHAEVGQGIFISDIQEGSFAEKAGLEIGEMILAVNKDSLVGSNYDTAANLLKRTEGLVTLVVSNPGKKDSTGFTTTGSQPQSNAIENNKNVTPKATLKPSSGPPSRPSTPVPEPTVDLATCPIVPGKEVAIEVFTDNKGLGIFFVGGKDTLIPNGIVLVEVYPGGTVDKDNRLRPGDQILDVNGTSMKDVTYNTASQALRQTLPKMKITVYRPEKLEYTKIDIDLIKKPGKGLGLSVIAKKSGKGVYVADIINGGIADVDGRIMKGDLLVSVNGQNVENASGEEAGTILKTVTGRISLSLHRYKTLAR